MVAQAYTIPMTETEFSDHIKNITRRILRFSQELGDDANAKTIGEQILVASASIGANYRAACREKSPNDLIANLDAVSLEAIKCVYWLEIMTDSKLIEPVKTIELVSDLDEIVSMAESSKKTLRSMIK